MLIGVVSDTHNYLDPRALPHLQGVDHILHAGDVGESAILDRLGQIAPVLAVRGNTDAGTPVGRQLPAHRWITWEAVTMYMTHIGGPPHELISQLPRQAEQRPQVYIYGHTHHALYQVVEGVVFLNPGSVGRPRFGGGVSLALLTLKHGQAEAQIITL